MNDEESLKRARRKVQQMRIFYIHALFWGASSAGLLLINLMTWSHYLWFLWPTLSWGIVLAIHGLAVFGLGSFLGPDWENRKIQEILEREMKSS
jgi:hypothetical protein